MKNFRSAAERVGLSLVIFKTALSAALSWLVATHISAAHYPYFAPLAAILTVQVTVADSLLKAVQRFLGIIGGVLVSLLITRWLDISAVSIFLVILLGMSISRALRLNPSIISQVAVSSFLVLLSAHNQGYAVSRILETFLGSGIALLLNSLIIPQRIVPSTEEHILKVSRLSSLTLSQLISLFKNKKRNPQTGHPEVNVLLTATNNAMQSLQISEQAMRYTPFLINVKVRMVQLAPILHNLEHITVQIRGIRRGLADLYGAIETENSFFDETLLQAAMEATAVCIENYGKAIVTLNDENRFLLKQNRMRAKELQARCLSEMQNISSLEILRDVGSILTDLSRILKEVEIED